MAVTWNVTRVHTWMRVPRPGRGARRFSLGFFLGAAVALVGLGVASESLAGRILPGVVAGGVDVGGLTPVEAREALVAALRPLETGRVTVTSDHGSVTIDVAAVGRTVELDRMVAEAAALGRDGTRFDSVVAAIRQSQEPVALPIRLTYDGDRLAATLTALRSAPGVRPSTRACS